jgi:hypothetical protein
MLRVRGSWPMALVNTFVETLVAVPWAELDPPRSESSRK